MLLTYRSDQQQWLFLRSQHAMGNDVVSEPSTLPGRFRTLFIALWQANASTEFNILFNIFTVFRVVPSLAVQNKLLRMHDQSQEDRRVFQSDCFGGVSMGEPQEMHFVCKQRRQLPLGISKYLSCALIIGGPPAGDKFDDVTI